MLKNCVLYKIDQKPHEGDSDWKNEYELDWMCLLYGLWPIDRGQRSNLAPGQAVSIGSALEAANPVLYLCARAAHC